MEASLLLHKGPHFDRCLEGLRKQGGVASQAAKKADEIIRAFAAGPASRTPEIGKVTVNGEYRIKNCAKYDLGSGYRLVFIKEGRHVALLYVGTHDDCFRWIERNKGLKYVMDETAEAVCIANDAGRSDDGFPEDVVQERRFVEEYESELMERIDEAVLHGAFAGWFKR